jgi:hypothetical protein
VPRPSRRRLYRHPIGLLTYVRLDHANGGIIRNLSSGGLAIQAVGRLHAGQVVHLRFDLLRPKIRIEATAEVTWADASGQAGVRFIDLAPRSQRLLKDWILTDLLAAASHLAPARAPILAGSEAAAALTMSAAPVRPILLASSAAVPAAPDLAAQDSAPAEMPVRLSWWPADVSPTTLARFIDCLIVVSAVLLFSVVSVATVGAFPSWIVASVLGAGAALVFGVVYCCLFQTLTGKTLGRRLAQLAAEDMHWADKPDDGPRFR